MFLALSPLEMVARPVDLPAEEIGAIVSELEQENDEPWLWLEEYADRVVGTCALCGRPVTVAEDDGTQHAHQACADRELDDVRCQGIADDEFGEWVAEMEATHG